MRNLCDTEDCLWKVTLLDQAMKPYHLVVLAGQLLWGLTDKGYSWLRTGLSHGACEFPSLCVGDMLLHFRKHPCVVVAWICFFGSFLFCVSNSSKRGLVGILFLKPFQANPRLR